MTEGFVFTETDRTKSKWVSVVYHDFAEKTGRTRTTMRGLFYFALQRKASDYPICGGFVGEIRITRPYHENDGEKLAKWTAKAQAMGLIPAGALLDDASAEKSEELVYIAQDQDAAFPRREVWVNKPSLNSLLLPVCKRHHATLVSTIGLATAVQAAALCLRSSSPTQIFCLSDLSIKSAFFAEDLAAAIGAEKKERLCSSIEIRNLGLLPEQVRKMQIPMIRAGGGDKQNMVSKKSKEAFKRYLQPFGLDYKGIAEIDALEANYPGGIAAFLDEMLSTQVSRLPGSIIMPAA